MKNTLLGFLFGVVCMSIGNLSVFGSFFVKEAQAASAYCEPIVKSSYKDFKKELTIARNDFDVKIVSSNMAIDSNGNNVFYALLCSQQ